MTKEIPKMKMPKWDVEDIDPTTMFLKDCRYYNGGQIAPEEIQKYWPKEKRKNIKK